MAESAKPKRPREQQQSQDEHQLFSSGLEITKRHKTLYNQILSILEDDTKDDEHQETTKDLTDFFLALQQELSSSDPLPELNIDADETIKEVEDKERVIRHLLEAASDDELGIPGYGGSTGGDEVPAGEHDGFPVTLCDELLEVEDDAAKYCTLLHSELIF